MLHKLIKTNISLLAIAGSAALGAISFNAGSALAQINIDNDVPLGTLGHFDVNVRSGGESTAGTLTANGQISGTISTNIIFQYLSYVDTGNGVIRLNTGTPALTGDDEVTSSGTFAGSNGNTITWTAVSSMNAGVPGIMTNAFTFTADQGTLGNLRLLQYLDEDVLGVSDDILFTRGSVAGGDLELFTVDDDEFIGISHGGAFSGAQGLVNSSFIGWQADEFDDLRSDIAAGFYSLSLAGNIDTGDLPPFVDPVVGAAFGPNDITSVLGWEVVSSATTATILTTLGGVADITEIPPDRPGTPEPGVVLGLFSLGLGSLLSRKKG